MLLLASFEKSGDKMTMEVGYSMPQISKYGSMLINYSMKIGFDGKKLGTAEGSMSWETVDQGNYSSSTKLTFSESAEAVSVSIEGYEEVGYELDGDYLIPEGLFGMN